MVRDGVMRDGVKSSKIESHLVDCPHGPPPAHRVSGCLVSRDEPGCGAAYGIQYGCRADVFPVAAGRHTCSLQRGVACVLPDGQPLSSAAAHAGS